MKESGDSKRPFAADGADAEDVERALERLYLALEQLLPELRESSKKVRARYEVDDVGTLSHLVQEDYSVKAENVEVPSFALSFRCVGRHDLTYKAATVDEKERVRTNLAQFGLAFTINDLSAWRYVLAVQPVVPVRFVFEPAPDRAAIRVTIHNLRRLGVERYSLEPEAVGPELIDEIRKLLLRQENRFSEFTGNRVSQEARERLQERLRQSALSKEKEYRAVGIEDPAAAAPGRLRRLLGRKDPQAGSSPASKVRSSGPAVKEQDPDSLGEIEWVPPDEEEMHAAALPEDAAAPAAGDALDDAARGAEPPAAPESGPAYAWFITHGVPAAQTATEVGRLGPSGATRRFSIPKVLSTGEEFRLLDREGEVRFGGRIVGQYEGVEPVVDFGIDHGCFIIEYRRGDQWVRVRASA